jgi:hypothetical protein
VVVDGEVIRVRGGKPMGPESQAAFAEVVRAAKRLMGSQITQGLMGDYTEAREVVVNRALEAQPKTDAALFDMLHSLFGVGDFDEAGTDPWFKFRIREIAKLKAIRRKRSISLADYAMTARYCYHHHEQVKESWQLCGFIADAKREARRIAVPELSQEIHAALEAERALPGPDSATWVERLLLTRGPFRRDVLDEWKQSRAVTTPVTNQGDPS